MSEMIQFFLIQTSLLAVVLLLHTYIGLHVVRRTLIFSDLVLDQLAAFGLMAGVGLGIQYGTSQSCILSMIAVLIGAALLAVVKPWNNQIPREAVIGIMYAMVLVATLLLGDKLTGGGNYVTKTLNGSMLWVTWHLVIVTIVVYIVLIAFHYGFRKKFIDLAEKKLDGPQENLWDFLFFTTQGIITVLIVPIAGVLLAYSFLMIPASIAAMFTKDWGRSIVFGWLTGFIACLLGLFSSYHYDLPYGPSLVLSLGIFFLFAVLIRLFISQRQKMKGN